MYVGNGKWHQRGLFKVTLVIFQEILSCRDALVCLRRHQIVIAAPPFAFFFLAVKGLQR